MIFILVVLAGVVLSAVLLWIYGASILMEDEYRSHPGKYL